MKSTDPDRRDLLDDLFSAREVRAAPALRDVLDAIQCEKQARRRRHHSLAAGACIAVVAGLVALLPSGRITPQPLSDQTATAGTGTSRPIQSTPELFQVERVDDEGLLKLLADTPTALVEWPDGRQALMLVVHTSAAK